MLNDSFLCCVSESLSSIRTVECSSLRGCRFSTPCPTSICCDICRRCSTVSSTCCRTRIRAFDKRSMRCSQSSCARFVTNRQPSILAHSYKLYSRNAPHKVFFSFVRLFVGSFVHNFVQKDEFTRLTALVYVSEFIEIGGVALLPHVAALVRGVLPSLAHSNDNIVTPNLFSFSFCELIYCYCCYCFVCSVCLFKVGAAVRANDALLTLLRGAS